METSEFQLIPKMAGSRAKIRVEGRAMVSPSSRNQDKLCSEMPGWKVRLARPQGRGREGV